MTTPNPILSPTVLLRPAAPGVWPRAAVYDPRWQSSEYSAYNGQRIVPPVNSLIKDSDGTPLWVIAVDEVTLYPTYEAATLSAINENVVSLLDYGNTVLRLYVDSRHAPYPATPDTKCVFIGKSPRFYTLSRYPHTLNETIISQHYDATGKLVSQMTPLIALDDTQTSWYLPRCSVNTLLEPNEEILVKVYNEEGAEVYTALLHAKESSVINADVLFSPSIIGMTVTGTQKLPNNSFYVYEKQTLAALGLAVTLLYDDGSTAEVPIDGVKCVMYGQNDFISSFAGLRQYLTIKYFRSTNEAINPSIADQTGSMISVDVPVTVIPNTLATTIKIMVMPVWNATISRYVMRYYMYFGDGRGFLDVTAFVPVPTTLNTTSAYFGIVQNFTITVDMKLIDPANYPVSTTFAQTVIIQFGPPTSTVRWTIRDASGSPYLYGQDTSVAKRPTIRFDRTAGQYFVPSYIFGNLQAFLNSFHSMLAPPYDPTISELPQTPTHFLLRDLVSGNMIVPAPIRIADYAKPFTVVGDTTGAHVGTTVVVEFVNIINNTTRNTLIGGAVDVTTGTYIAP